MNEEAKDPVVDEKRVPDAVLLPHHMKVGTTTYDRVAGITEHCRPILGPGMIYVHTDLAGILANRDPTHKMNHADRSPRYDWEDRPDGTKWGYLRADRP